MKPEIEIDLAPNIRFTSQCLGAIDLRKQSLEFEKHMRRLLVRAFGVPGMTHTYALLELSQPAYDEIAAKLRAAGYQHAFSNSGPNAEIDMHGIGVAPDPEAQTITLCGVKYAIALFRHLGFGPIGSMFQIVSRKDDIVELQRIDPMLGSSVEKGWIIENGNEGDDRRYRFMNDVGLVDWTARIDDALRFARRVDAESFSRQDEDAWTVTEHEWKPVFTEPVMGTEMVGDVPRKSPGSS